MGDEKAKKKKKVSLSKKLKQNPWILSTLVFGIIAVILIVSSLSMPGQVSKDAAGNNFVDFINSRGGAELEYLSSENFGSSLYEVTVLSDGSEVPVYITQDGKYFVQIISPIVESDEDDSTPSTPSDTSSPDVTKTAVPTAELFVMTHCPYGTQAEKGFIPALTYFGDAIDAKIRFVHYFMHEPEETETPRQVCIREEQQDKWITYLTCFLEDGDAARCDAEVGIDSAALAECISSGRADDYYEEDSTLSEQYGVRGSPSLVLNGEMISTDRSPAGFLDTICQAFSDVPELCGGSLDSASPSPMWGWDATSSGTTASCG